MATEITETPHIRKKAATMSQVASLAGVSTQTVSYVISGNKKVSISKATRERVLAAAVTVGYQPNRLARAMKSGKTMTIAVWMPISRPVMRHYLGFLAHLQTLANLGGYELAMIPVSRDQETNEETPSPTLWPADGMIAFDCVKAVQKYRSQTPYGDIPCVSISMSETDKADQMRWDTDSAFKAMTLDAIQATGTDPAFLTIRLGIEIEKEYRKIGYLAAMKEANRTPICIVSETESVEDAYIATLAHLKSNGVQNSYICWNDFLAWGLMKALNSPEFRDKTKHVRIYSMGGFEPMMSCNQEFKTLSVPLEEAAKESWRLLSARIENYDLPYEQLLLPLKPAQIEPY